MLKSIFLILGYNNKLEITEDDNLDKNIVVEDDKIHIKSSVFTSPGTSEVCF